MRHASPAFIVPLLSLLLLARPVGSRAGGGSSFGGRGSSAGRSGSSGSSAGRSGSSGSSAGRSGSSGSSGSSHPSSSSSSASANRVPVSSGGGNAGATSSNGFLGSSNNYGSGSGGFLGGGSSSNRNRPYYYPSYSSSSSSSSSSTARNFLMGALGGALAGAVVHNIAAPFRYHNRDYYWSSQYYQPQPYGQSQMCSSALPPGALDGVTFSNSSPPKQIVWSCATYQYCCQFDCCASPDSAGSSFNSNGFQKTLLGVPPLLAYLRRQGFA